ncbi:MAG: hypothetical protein AAFX99_04085, partial [Myxococcota bacterium]
MQNSSILKAHPISEAYIGTDAHPAQVMPAQQPLEPPMNALLILLLLSVGLLNLAPITGIVSSEILQNAYGVTLTDPNLVILMRHRAALFGIIGGLIVACAFLPSLRLVAIITGLVSMISF